MKVPIRVTFETYRASRVKRNPFGLTKLQRGTEASRKQREKRRRRLIGQQEKLMTDLELHNRESLVLELMKRQSNQEKELDYETWRTN